MNRVLICLLAVALCACNPFPKTPDEEDAAQAAKEKAIAKAAPTATPRKPGDWMYDKKTDGLSMKDKNAKGHPVSPLGGASAQATPRKDTPYRSPLDQKGK